MGIMFTALFIVVSFIELFFWVFIIRLISYVIQNAIKKRNYDTFKSNTINGKNIDIHHEYPDLTLNDLIRYRNKISDLYGSNFKDVNKKTLDLFNVSDINVLKDYFYDIFEQFEKALNNLDYQQIKSLTTNQLYENYCTGIELDIKAGNKRVLDNIKRKNISIYEMDSTISKQMVSTLIEIEYTNYTVSKDGLLVKGSKQPITEIFIVKFRKDFKDNIVQNCPNCGAPVDKFVCSYCGTPINRKNDFKISNIQRIV